MTLLTVHWGEHVVEVRPEKPFTIGRDGDLVIGDNPFLHRSFLRIESHGGVPVLSNVGDLLAATVCDEDGRFEALLGPGAVLPIAFPRMLVRFTAGAESYELVIEHPDAGFRPPPSAIATVGGATTLGNVALTSDQHLLVVALAESALRSNGAETHRLPSSKTAARRLGWTEKKFNRKLDNVCSKLSALGVRGLHGHLGDSAMSRRARLVEYSLAVRLVVRDDLQLLGALDDESAHGGDRL